MQIGIHRRTLGLVLWQHLHTHARAALVKGHRDSIGPKLVDHLEKHIQKAEDCVRRTAIGGIHRGRHRVERTMHERIAVHHGDGLT